jgi:O-6-methylguanine DNA methyltransferase
MTKLTDQLAALATTAPEGLADAVLTATETGKFYDIVPGPTGDLVVGWSRAGVYGVAPEWDADEFIERHSAPPLVPLRKQLPTRLHDQIDRVLESGKVGRLRIDLSDLTEFQQAVLRKAAEIPPGQLRPYGWIAREIGKPGATRAVGSALNKNPVPVLIPCHRVGRSDGTVGQYAYGPEMKRALLSHEGLDPDAVDAAAERGVRYLGSTTTNIYCLPTCHNARRIRDRNRVELKSAQAAETKGFRACKVCRPVAAA